MKKWVLYTLVLLGVNFLMTFLAELAFMLLLFRADPILAAVPALFSLPAIVLQPWFLVFLFLPNTTVVAPILTTLVSVFVYGWLNSQGNLDRPKQILSRFNTRRVIVASGCVVLLLISLAFARWVDFPVLNHGTPPPIQVTGLNVTDSRYYCLGRFIDSAWLWQARLPESELAQLSSQLNLRPAGREQIPAAFRKMPPYWWHPVITDCTTILSTPNFPLDERGPDGRHVFATWNGDDQVLHVWIKNNF